MSEETSSKYVLKGEDGAPDSPPFTMKLEVDWLPINCAPKDGTEVLLYVPDFKKPICMGYFVDSEDLEYGKTKRKRKYWFIVGAWYGVGSDRDAEPTHWAPLPEPPKQRDAIKDMVQEAQRLKLP